MKSTLATIKDEVFAVLVKHDLTDVEAEKVLDRLKFDFFEYTQRSVPKSFKLREMAVPAPPLAE